MVHANIAHSPYEFEGIVPNYELFTFKGDGKKLVNAAIDDLAARDGFAATHLVDDSVSLKLSYDPLHLNGVGEVVHGLRKADSFLALLDATLSFCGFDEKVQASAVDLCNIALSHVGDAGQITSINPPDGSPQSLHCARFYPAARDMVLALRPWTFARRRATLTEVTNTRTEWDFAYAAPLDMLMPTAVTANDATDDNIAGASFLAPAPSPQVQPRRQVEPTGYVPQPYVLERDDAGYRVIYTDQASANLRYQARVTDATEFPPLFRLAVSYQLAALLAGPLVKGDVGRTVAEQFMKMLMLTVAQAADTDATQQRTLSNRSILGFLTADNLCRPNARCSNRWSAVRLWPQCLVGRMIRGSRPQSQSAPTLLCARREARERDPARNTLILRPILAP